MPSLSTGLQGYFTHTKTMSYEQDTPAGDQAVLLSHNGGSKLASAAFKISSCIAMCEDRVRDGPASGEKGSKGRKYLDCIRDNGLHLPEEIL